MEIGYKPLRIKVFISLISVLLIGTLTGRGLAQGPGKKSIQIYLASIFSGNPVQP